MQSCKYIKNNLVSIYLRDFALRSNAKKDKFTTNNILLHLTLVSNIVISQNKY